MRDTSISAISHHTTHLRMIAKFVTRRAIPPVDRLIRQRDDLLHERTNLLKRHDDLISEIERLKPITIVPPVARRMPPKRPTPAADQQFAAPDKTNDHVVVSFEGRQVELTADPTDCHFQSLQDHISGFSRLAKAASDLPNGSVIFDVGANIGLSAIALAIAAPNCRVVCFEPSPTNFRHLKENVERFACGRISIHQVAVSNGQTTLHLFTGVGAETWSGGWSHVVGENSTDKGSPVVKIQAIRLDDFDEATPALIKIDVEGHEPEVIAGAARIIETARPLMCVEFNPWTLNAFGGHSPAAFATALFDAFDVEGYEDAGALLHSTLSRGHIADVYLRPKGGKAVPLLPQMSWPPSALSSVPIAS